MSDTKQPADGQPGDERLMDHAYDGIQEYDNPMPKWWLYGFYATVVFAAIYFFDPRKTFEGPGREREYAMEMEQFEREHPQPKGIDEGALLAAVADANVVHEGSEVFARNCAACHRADGGGLIGPNLTDAAWLHGGTPKEIHHTIAEGVLAKGMPAWGKMLKPEEVLQVTAYVVSLGGKNVEGGKAAEGVVAAAVAPADSTAAGR